MRRLAPLVLVAAVLGSVSCAIQKRVTSNSLDFLYPREAEPVAPSDVSLRLPVRVGVAFAPAAATWQEPVDEAQKQALLEQVAAAFRDRPSLEHVQVIPSSFLSAGGGFDNLERIAAAFGIDVIALLSYDQFQFSETTRASWTYWTVVGIYLVKGEKNQTRTLMEAVIVDIPSHAMLFTASGQSTIGGRATPIDVPAKLRLAADAGFAEATVDLIANLKTALDAFAQQAATGTVRGQGTPAIVMVDDAGRPTGQAPSGAGSVGWLEPCGLLALLALGSRAWRRHGSRPVV